MDDRLLVYGIIALVSFQSVFMAVDEWGYHRRRGLGLWERYGHPVDSIVYLLTLSIPALARPYSGVIQLYVAAAIVSCLTITKDEWVHARACEPGEHWVHALLFMVHPAILVGVGHLWLRGSSPTLLAILPAILAAFALYQIIYWILFPEWKSKARAGTKGKG